MTHASPSVRGQTSDGPTSFKGARSQRVEQKLRNQLPKGPRVHNRSFYGSGVKASPSDSRSSATVGVDSRWGSTSHNHSNNEHEQ